MRNGASTYVTAQFISSILAARPTAVGEVAETFSIVADTVARLLHPGGPAAAPISPPSKPEPQRQVRPAKIAAPEPTTPDVAVVKAAKSARGSKPEILTEGATVPKRRGRPPRSATLAATIAPETAVAETAVAETAAPVSRLLRRNDVTAPAAPAASVDPFDRDPLAENRVKGVVKWFDTRTNKGVLRLTGMAGDIALDATLLTRSRIKRLYKDQEVEVSGTFLDGKFQPRSLTVPGQTQETLVTNGQVLHAAGRQSRPVFVEVKRINPRLQSARAEAEHALGRGSKNED